jgi:hypothetical protein
VAPDAKAWVSWAAGQPRVPAEMLALLSFRPDLITDFDPMSGEKAFATPRTWLKAAHYYSSPDARGRARRIDRGLRRQGRGQLVPRLLSRRRTT